MLKKSRISVIIPTLNEEKAVGKVLNAMPMDIVDEIIVVDSSTDGTAKVAKSLNAKVVFERRLGYGRALQTGIAHAKGDIVVYMDGDGTYDPKEIVDLVMPTANREYNVILGNRLSRSMLPGAMNRFNRFGNFLLSLIFSVLFLKRIRDTQSGFRAIDQSFLAGLSYHNHGMPFVTEQLIKLMRRGAKVGEVPITYSPRIGQTKLCSWTDGVKILRVIFRERLQEIRYKLLG